VANTAIPEQQAWPVWLAGLAKPALAGTRAARLPKGGRTAVGLVKDGRTAVGLVNGGRAAVGLVLTVAVATTTLRPSGDESVAVNDAPTRFDDSVTLDALGSVAQRPLLSEAPATLAETGLYSDWSTRTIAADLLPFSPQYPLWSDGATKQRWIYLPSAIDARAWTLPVGTRIWKQFSFGERVETRFMMRTAAGWTYATYLWPGGARASRSGAEVGTHRVPSESDCRACHGNAASPVLGFSALQLSVDRDPGAPHRETRGVDLLSLVIAGYVTDLDDIAPRIPGSPVQRAALGYLHGNCNGCHRADGPLAGLGMDLSPAAALRTTANVTAKFAAQPRLTPGDAEHSLLVRRMSARQSLTQMPPIGTDVVDAEALRLVADWIDQLAVTH